MRQLGKVKATSHAYGVASPWSGREEGEGSPTAMDCYSSRPLTSILSPSTRGEAENLGPAVQCESRNLGNSISSVPTCVATRLRAGAVVCAVLSAVIRATHKLR
jgi:hypothetical protein